MLKRYKFTYNIRIEKSATHVMTEKNFDDFNPLLNSHIAIKTTWLVL